MFDSESTYKTYRIRRLRCTLCGKIHHELPDFIVPYKRFSSKLITAILEQPEIQEINGATIQRLHRWFDAHALGFITTTLTIRLKYAQISVAPSSEGTSSKLDRLKSLYDYHANWLSHLVKTLANFNFWPQTRSVVLST